jgi:hypothetical protein
MGNNVGKAGTENTFIYTIVNSNRAIHHTEAMAGISTSDLMPVS